jgi:adenine-specific DNA-methyltransferase
MNYIGSKYKLLPFISRTIGDVCGDTKNKSFCDLFAGTGIVSRFFKDKFNSVISNDFEYYSYVILKTYIENNQEFNVEFLNHLNELEGIIFHNYSENGREGRLYFSEHNGKQIDAIRTEINRFTENEFYYYLCSLLEASDKVANVASVYGAYLKQLKLTAQRNIELQKCHITKNHNTRVFNKDANELIKEIQGDVLYLDPPYNQRQYSGNYHLLNTIALYDTFKPKGITGQRLDNKSSKYCSKSKIDNVFEHLIKNAQFNYIFMSYNNDGLMSMYKIKEIMGKYGKYSLEKCSYNGYSNQKNMNKNTTEYIHILEKTM